MYVAVLWTKAQWTFGTGIEVCSETRRMASASARLWPGFTLMQTPEMWIIPCLRFQRRGTYLSRLVFEARMVRRRAVEGAGVDRLGL